MTDNVVPTDLGPSMVSKEHIGLCLPQTMVLLFPVGQDIDSNQFSFQQRKHCTGSDI